MILFVRSILWDLGIPQAPATLLSSSLGGAKKSADSLIFDFER
jgi:hypothetical protein